MIDLWVRSPTTFLTECLTEGYRNFTWHIGYAMAKKVDPLSRLRAGTLAFGQESKLMLVDYAGAPEYGMFSKYEKPEAVYPTWACDEDFDTLEDLVINPVGENKKICTDKSVPSYHRPVLGQKHRVVIHRVDNGGAGVNTGSASILKRVRELQLQVPWCEIFVSGMSSFDRLFDWGFQAADYRPYCLTNDQVHPVVLLPSGKLLRDDKLFDKRYADWFELLGMTQDELFNCMMTNNRKPIVTFCLRSAQWARRNYDKVTPFTVDRRSKALTPVDSALVETSSDKFVLPAARRRVMRNIGIGLNDELDKFLCDTCILHNTCTLYREGSVCTLKGSDAVALAENFGTRSADLIIDALGALLQRQAERMEDALADEDADGKHTDPEVTKQMNSVFANGVKLAKLIDPNLTGGAKVQVNVGGPGNVQVVQQADPRQITAQVVRELEAQGIPRERITGELLKGYFESMGINGQKQAVQAVKATHKKKTPRVAGDAEDAYSPEEQLLPKIINGTLL